MISTSIARTRWAAVGAAVAITLGAVGIGGLNIANADVSTGNRPVFVSINPCRLVDTRPGDTNAGPRDTPLGSTETLTVTAHGSNGECTGASAIPADALSLAMNVTAARPTADTFLTFWGVGANPGTSNLNPRAGAAPTPNAVNTPLSPSGTFNVYNNAGTVDLVVDVNGYYANHNHDDRYYTEAESDGRFVVATRHDRTYTVTARLNSDGSLSRAQGLPDGASLGGERQATGNYRVFTSGLEPLGAAFARPIIVVTAISGSEVDCRHAGGGSVAGEPLSTYSTDILCSNSDGNAANAAFNIAIFFEEA